MAWQTVAEGSGKTLATIIGYEDQVAEGQRGRLSLSLTNPLSPNIANQLQNQLDAYGVIEAQVSTSGKNCDITYRKGFPWLAIIVAIVLGLMVLAILIVSWQFAKEMPVQFSLLALGALAAGAGLVVYLIRKNSYVAEKRVGGNHG